MYYVNENVNTPLLPKGGAFPIPLSSYIYGTIVYNIFRSGCAELQVELFVYIFFRYGLHENVVDVALLRSVCTVDKFNSSNTDSTFSWTYHYNSGDSSLC